MSAASPTFPATAEDFYRLRDDRTNLYADVDRSYHDKRVLITAEPGLLETLPGQVMLVVSANLLARWCRHVRFEVTDQPLDQVIGTSSSLLTFVLASMRDADPFGDFSSDHSPDADLHLHIGASCPARNTTATIISANGWYAAVRRQGEPTLACESTSPIGAVAAAILGGAQLFRDALARGDLYGESFLFDVFYAQPVSSLVRRPWEDKSANEVGRVALVGGGAVGSSAAYFMRLLGLRAQVGVVDGDIVKVENFARSPILGRANYGLGKASAVKAAMSSDKLDVEAQDIWWDDYPNRSLSDIDLVIPAANEHGVRWAIQSSSPPLMVHASTDRNWHVNFGRHIPGCDDCLADRFAEFEGKPLFGCASGSVDAVTAPRVDASLPFLSFFAGFLIATDLVRLGIPGYPHTPNFADYGFRKNCFRPHLYSQTARDGCICRTQIGGFWRFRGETRYSYLSPNRSR